MRSEHEEWSAAASRWPDTPRPADPDDEDTAIDQWPPVRPGTGPGLVPEASAVTDAPGSWFTPAPKPDSGRAGPRPAGRGGPWFDPRGREGRSLPGHRPSRDGLERPVRRHDPRDEPDQLPAGTQDEAPRGSAFRGADPDDEDTAILKWPPRARGETATRTDLPAAPGPDARRETVTRTDMPAAPGPDARRETVTRTDMPAAPGPAGPRRGRDDSPADSWAAVTRGGTPAGVRPPRPGAFRAGPGGPDGDAYRDHDRARRAPAGDRGPGAGYPRARPGGGGDVGLRQEAPFRNVKPISLGTPKSTNAPPGLPSAFRRTQTGTFRRIRDTQTIKAIMDTSTMRAIMDTAAIQVLRDRLAGKSKVVATVVIAFWGVMAVVIFLTLFRHGDSTAAPGTARKSPAATSPARPTSRADKSPAPPSGGKGHGAQVEALPVASVTAVGPNGTADGDNPGSAANVIIGSASAPWHTKWYRSARFGMLKPGTGLLLDMGRIVVVYRVELRLAPGSADVEILVGDSRSGLATAAARDNAGGTVDVRLTRPTTGRYVEVWFTALPRDPAGTYQETVYGVQASGHP